MFTQSFRDAITVAWKTRHFTHTTLFTFGKGSTIIRKKNESEHLTNQQHETLKNAT